MTDTLSIQGIHIGRYGGELDPFARVVVTVTLADGQEVEVIEEYLHCAFSHYVSVIGIRAAALKGEKAHD